VNYHSYLADAADPKRAAIVDKIIQKRSNKALGLLRREEEGECLDPGAVWNYSWTLTSQTVTLMTMTLTRSI